MAYRLVNNFTTLMFLYNGVYLQNATVLKIIGSKKRRGVFTKIIYL